MPLRITFADKQIGHRYRLQMDRLSKRSQRTVLRAVSEMRDTALRDARDDIAGAGNFGRRWTQGLHGDLTVEGDEVNVAFSHDVPYFSVFQFGKVIHGRPMLFIPFSFARDAQGVSARDYPGKLFRVVRKRDNLTMLWSVRTREPKYFGKESVRIPKKFHVIEIIRDTVRRMRRLFTTAWTRES